MNNAGPGGGGLLQGLFGGGMGAGMLDGFMTPEMKQQMAQRKLMGLAQGLLSASGPSRMPVSFGQAMGQGLQGMQGQDESMLKEMTAMAALKKAQEVDADKLGETAFMKAAQGIPLNPQEQAALKYIDAKSPTSAFNPVTGNMETKPSLLDRAGMGGQAPAAGQQPQNMPQAAPTIGAAPTGQGMPAQTPGEAPSEWDQSYQQELAAAQGNPRLQQAIKENYAKAKISMSDAEAKAAGFSDRMLQSNPLIDQYKNAGMDQWQLAKGSIPILGNYITSGDYQSFNQAQRDFINAQLRRESGAVISPGEFDNAEKQYFPKPGDTPQVIQQKAANREAAVKGMQRSAGPAYKPLKLPQGASAGNSSVSKPSDDAVQFLMQNPQFAPQFEQKYRISSKTYLGVQ